MNKRGAYFFVIDAIIASLVVFATLVFIFSSYQTKPESNPSQKNLEHYLQFLASTKVSEYPGQYMEGLIIDNNITDLDNTLQDQIIEFYYLNKSNPARYGPILRNFMINITKAIIPPDRSLQVYINNTLVYNRTMKDLDISTLKISSKRLCFKRINESYIYGPVVLEAKLWI